MSIAGYDHLVATKKADRGPARARRGRATIRDIAAAAGVSVTTVSHALNGKGRVDPATRDRIKALATSLAYLPSQTARSLVSGRTFTLGLSLPQIARLPLGELLGSDWYGRIVIAASQRAILYEHAITVMPAFAEPAELARFPVDGMLVLNPSERDPRLDLLRQARKPFVCLGQDPSSPSQLSVRPDTAGGTDALLAHLVEQGARSVLFLTGPWTDDSYAETFAVSDKWAATTGLKVAVRQVAGAAATTQAAIAAATTAASCQAVAAADPPDAIVGLFEQMGPAIVEGVRRAGRGVPADVLVAQDTDEPAVRAATPSITALDLHLAEQAAAGVDLLIASLAGHNPASVRTPVSLHVRESSRRA